MTALNDFNPLESLLLFQSLAAYGVQEDSFVRIADALNSSNWVHHASAKPYTADTLRTVYLRLLKEEAKQELQDALDREAVDANSPAPSLNRKRKAPTPTLPTVEAAAGHAHLVPQLVSKLYSRYQEQVIHEIREEEKIYDRLVASLRNQEPNGDGDNAVSKDAQDGIEATDVRTEKRRTTETNPGDVGPGEAESDIHSTLDSTPALARDGQDIIDEDATGKLTGTSAETAPPVAGHGSGQPSPVSPSRPSTDVSARVRGSAADDRMAVSASNITRHLHQSTPTLQKQTSQNQPSQITPGPRGLTAAAPTPTTALHHRNAASSYPNSAPQPAHRRQEITVTPHPKGGYQLPPFQLEPPSSSSTAAPQSRSQEQASSQSRPSGFSSGLSGNDRLPRLSSEHMHLANTPERIFNRPGVVITPGSSTQWKVNAQTPSINEVERPRSHSISPISDREGSPRLNTASKTVKTRSNAVSRLHKATPRRKESPTEESNSGSLKILKASRTGSRTSSTRSHSIAPTSDTFTPTSTHGRRGVHVKAEPRTPAASSEPDAMDMSTPEPLGPQASSKRKPAHLAAPVNTLTLPKATHILAHRNFAKMTKDVMNSITSHKHASIFANPIREKDAEGYTDIIRRPQDLKSIRAMIGAGSRAVASLASSMQAADASGTNIGSSSFTSSSAAGAAAAAAAAAAPSPGAQTPSSSSPSTGAVLSLPLTADLAPPRAIVNADQFEKEIMRMFANAVMFNPGEEDLVTETREMFETVEAELNRWRETERSLGEVAGTQYFGSAPLTGGGGGAGGMFTPGAGTSVGASALRRGIEGDVDELAADDGEMDGLGAAPKRRRIA